MNQQIKAIIAAAIFFAAGIVIVILGLNSKKEIKNFPEIQATVAGVEVEWTNDGDGGQTREETVWVNYTIDGVEYEEILQGAPGNLSQGDVVTAHYNPEKPTYITGATSKSSTLLIVFGAVFALFGSGSIILKLIRGR